MPHITLVYPFCAADAHDWLAPRLAAACRAVEPFQVLLRRFGVFRGKGDRHVIWLTPEPSDRLQALHGVVSRSLPDCVGPPPGAEGYVPHLTVGRVGGWPNARRELAVHAARWEPVAFAVDQVSILVRGAPPEDAFRVTRHIPLGGP
jgi:2'-5' RNA ligase